MVRASPTTAKIHPLTPSQAPTSGKKRTTMRAKVAAATRPATTSPNVSTSSSNTKAGKRALKHDTLISRIEKSQKKPLKRRRPGKKLNTALDSLADALPELEEEGSEDDDEWEGIDEEGDAQDTMLGTLRKQVRVRKAKPVDGKMKLKTLKSRPGALKRKQKMEESEKERFGRNCVVVEKGKRAWKTFDLEGFRMGLGREDDEEKEEDMMFG
ncbi:hypothetical protein D6D17_01030 [Aureobasidium pullulans]|nr:hypothetical protein D6D17_01030 [Aureobasidium pullulans]